MSRIPPGAMDGEVAQRGAHPLVRQLPPGSPTLLMLPVQIWSLPGWTLMAWRTTTATTVTNTTRPTEGDWGLEKHEMESVMGPMTPGTALTPMSPEFNQACIEKHRHECADQCRPQLHRRSYNSISQHGQVPFLDYDKRDLSNQPPMWSRYVKCTLCSWWQRNSADI
jgi:hypothetical protein